MENPKFKSIKIKLDKEHTYTINSKGVLQIQTIKTNNKDLNINKLNQALSMIKNNFEPPKKRGPKKKEIIQEVPIIEKKKRGRKKKITEIIQNIETAPIEQTESEQPLIEEPTQKRGRGRPRTKNLKKLTT